MRTKVRLVFIAVFFLNTALAFSIETSGLLQYGENTDRHQLVLLENRKMVNLGGNYLHNPFVTGTYVIHNRGGEYASTLGVLFRGLRGVDDWPSPTEAGIQFTVNGIHILHTERIDIAKFVMGDRIVEQPAVINAWTLIDVVFPENSITTIQVWYRTAFSEGGLRSLRRDGSAWVLFNTFSEIDPFANMGYWRGPTKFSIEILNDPASGNDIEGDWISSMVFFHAEDGGKNIDTREYLQRLQSLETDLMSIQRLNGNTIRIGFTEKFMNNYRRGFAIETRSWTAELGAYISYFMPSGEIALGFLRNDVAANISQRVLAPYELIFLTNSQLRLVRNAFFARHGFAFQSSDLQRAFNHLWSFGLPFEPSQAKPSTKAC